MALSERDAGAAARELVAGLPVVALLPPGVRDLVVESFVPMEFIFGENLGRYAEAVGEQSRGMLFYIPVMLADLFPWSMMIPIALWWTWRHERQDRVARLLFVWIAAIVVFFSLSGTKEDLYILPIVPAEAAERAMLAKVWKYAVAWPLGPQP